MLTATARADSLLQPSSSLMIRILLSYVVDANANGTAWRAANDR